jgi:hypothetical protein
MPLLETILTEWQTAIGSDYPAYKNHIYRMIHFRLALRECNEEE